MLGHKQSCLYHLEKAFCQNVLVNMFVYFICTFFVCPYAYFLSSAAIVILKSKGSGAKDASNNLWKPGRRGRFQVTDTEVCYILSEEKDGALRLFSISL